MNDLFRIIGDNPLLLILVAGWLLSTLGSLGAKAARKAAEQQQRQAQRATERQQQTTLPPATAQAAPAARPVPRPRPVRRPAVPDPDEIAAELRRLMGLEPEKPPRPEPVVRPPEVARRPMPVVVEVETPPPWQHEMPSAHMPSAAMASHSQPVTARSAASRPARRGGRLLDIRHPAAAFVAMEVLGPPRALRGWE